MVPRREGANGTQEPAGEPAGAGEATGRPAATTLGVSLATVKRWRQAVRSNPCVNSAVTPAHRRVGEGVSFRGTEVRMTEEP